MAKVTKIRVRLKAYDHVSLDLSAEKIIAAAKTLCNSCRSNSAPNGKASVHHSPNCSQIQDSREQFEIRTHKRIIDIRNYRKETLDSLKNLDLPAGVDIEIKL